MSIWSWHQENNIPLINCKKEDIKNMKRNLTYYRIDLPVGIFASYSSTCVGIEDFKDLKKNEQVFSKFTRISINMVLTLFNALNSKNDADCNIFMYSVQTAFSVSVVIVHSAYVYGDGMRIHFSLSKKHSFLQFVCIVIVVFG